MGWLSTRFAALAGLLTGASFLGVLGPAATAAAAIIQAAVSIIADLSKTTAGRVILAACALWLAYLYVDHRGYVRGEQAATAECNKAVSHCKDVEKRPLLNPIDEFFGK